MGASLPSEIAPACAERDCACGRGLGLSPRLRVGINSDSLHTIMFLHAHLEALALDSNAPPKAHKVSESWRGLRIIPVIGHL